MSIRRPTLNQQRSSFLTNKSNTFTMLNLKPGRYHAYHVMLFIFGSLFPPLAVAARFGIGSDFWLNLLLTICGYIPGHAIYKISVITKYGLVDNFELKRK